MDSLISFLCLCSFFVPTGLGLGLTLLLERFLGVWAYLVGWLLPLILLIGLYVADALWMRANPCEPADNLGCGEVAAYTLILFMGIFALTVIVNAIAQGVMFLVLRARRQRRSMVQ